MSEVHLYRPACLKRSKAFHAPTYKELLEALDHAHAYLGLNDQYRDNDTYREVCEEISDIIKRASHELNRQDRLRAKASA